MYIDQEEQQKIIAGGARKTLEGLKSEFSVENILLEKTEDMILHCTNTQYEAFIKILKGTKAYIIENLYTSRIRLADLENLVGITVSEISANLLYFLPVFRNLGFDFDYSQKLIIVMKS